MSPCLDTLAERGSPAEVCAHVPTRGSYHSAHRVAGVRRPRCHVVGRTRAAPGVPLSEDEEVALGRLAAAEIEKDLTLLTDDAVTSYVSELGLALAARSGRSHLTYQFKVVDAAEINAFALPGGFIYVHRGLIEATDTEAELAGVLGHEIGHVVARHGAKQAQRAAIATLGLRVLGSVLGRGTGGRIGAMAAEMVTAGTFMRFSRDAEREADRLGAENVAAGGHDPHGMVTFLREARQASRRAVQCGRALFLVAPQPGRASVEYPGSRGLAHRRA